MFESFNTNRGQTAAANRRRRFDRARPLVVEAMEGRLMLAATWLEFAPSNIPAAQYHLSFDSVSLNSIQSIQAGSLNQGGFIPPVLPNAGVTGNVVRSDNAEVFTDGTPMTTNGAPYIGKWFDFGGLDSANGNLRPAVISISDDGSGLQSNLESVFAGSPRQGAPASEGGAIPIADLLPGAGGPTGDDRRMMLAEHGDQSIHSTRLAKEARDLSARTIQLAAAERPAPLKITLDESAAKLAPSLNADSISGEWARAMVFELAGGEPTELSRPALGDQSRMHLAPEDAPANDDTPLSNIRAHYGIDQLVAYRANNVQARAAAIESDRHAQPIKESVTLMHSAVGQLNAFARGPNWHNGHSDLASLALTTLIAAHTLAPAIPGSINNSPPNAAGSASLTEFEESETTAIRSSADDAWGPPEIAPLVMVLALEQARAANLRRAKKHAATLTWPPRRFAKRPDEIV